jgi:putative membrane protein
VWWWTAVVSAAVYAVLAYVLSSEPPVAVPHVVALLISSAPHLIAVINATALVSLLLGYRAIRAGRIHDHRKFMLVSASLISAFLILYVTRVALGGVKTFSGPAIVRTLIYLPTLTVHISLSILSVPLIVHNLLVGLTQPSEIVGRTAHPKVGRWAVSVWSTSLALGLIVYLLLNIIY